MKNLLAVWVVAFVLNVQNVFSVVAAFQTIQKVNNVGPIPIHHDHRRVLSSLRIPRGLRKYKVMTTTTVTMLPLGRSKNHHHTCNDRTHDLFGGMQGSRTPRIFRVKEDGSTDDDDGKINQDFPPKNDFGDGPERRRKSRSTARVGGRSRNLRDDSVQPKKEKPKSSLLGPTWLAGILAVVLVLIYALSGDGGGDYYYYSYQTTIYETTAYGADGKAETKRDESSNFRTNVPGFTQPRQQGKFDQRQRLLLGPIDFYDDEVDGMVQDVMPRTIDQFLDEMGI